MSQHPGTERIHPKLVLDNLLIAESIDEREEDDLCSSNHFILDRIAEKESMENLYRAGSSHGSEDIDIKQVNKPLHVYIDGPFGAPTSQIFHAQHAILIGTGIGVTPFASILQSIMHRYSILVTFLSNILQLFNILKT